MVETEVRYYFVSHAKVPKPERSIVLRLKEGELEKVAGVHNPFEIGCSVNSAGQLCIPSGYKADKIELDEADILNIPENANPYSIFAETVKKRMGSATSLGIAA